MGNYKVDNQNSDQSTDQTSSDQSSADSRFSNRSPDELVLNAMLRDFLKRNLPPNFENRILASLVSRRTSNSVLLNKRSFTEDELDAALGAALADIEFGQQSSHDRVASSFEEKWIKRMDPYWWDYKRVRTVAAFIGLAASLCFAYLFIPKPDWFPWNKTVPNEGDFLAEASAINPNVENEKQELATPDVFPSDETPLPETVLGLEKQTQNRRQNHECPGLKWRISSIPRSTTFGAISTSKGKRITLSTFGFRG